MPAGSVWIEGGLLIALLYLSLLLPLVALRVLRVLPGPGEAGRPRGAASAALGAILALLFLAPPGIGALLDQVNFTWGRLGHHAELRMALPVFMAAGFLGSRFAVEPLLRDRLQLRALSALPAAAAIAAVAALATALQLPLALPALARGAGLVDVWTVFFAFLASGALFQITRSVAGPALLSTAVLFVPRFFLSDVEGSFPSLGHFVAASPAFAALQLLLPAGLGCVCLWAAWREGRPVARDRLRLGLAWAFLLLPVWTLAIKFAAPAVVALREGEVLSSYFMWDFWWAAHLWMSYLLFRPSRWTVRLAVVMTPVEIAIILVKYALFLRAPGWDLWHAHWFANKLFVLAAFLALGAWVLRAGARRRAVA